MGTDFDLIGGVGIMGFISPMNTEDTYPVIDPLFGVDGLRNVNTIEDLNLISYDRRRGGMIVGVEGGSKYYRLKNIDWIGDISDWEQIAFLLVNGGQSSIRFIDKEIPSGVVDGDNDIFILDNIPSENSEHIFLNGLLQKKNKDGIKYDYDIIGDEIHFELPPLPSMEIVCSYRTS